MLVNHPPDFECFLAENQIKNSQDFADRFSDTLDENRYFDIPRILCYKEDLKSTPFVFEGKVGEDTIEKLLKEKETIILPNVTKYKR
ncbi:Uncharacterised protein [Campylobacter jejuni subsp. doylei]|uniref:Uncharacterized protein n=1 Tax=Campylobacter jejuni subsp. doylei TaxID=32021 RepID=A0A448J6Y8_CAMJU|nr:Uncharacterised protein [Campylobacter jejuni subsp. doylei]